METILSPAESNFSISLSPLLLGDYDAGPDSIQSGCVVSVYDSDDKHEDNKIKDELISKLQEVVGKPARLGLVRSITRLLMYQTDTIIEIVDSVKKLAKKNNKSNTTTLRGGEDEMIWFVKCRSQMIRSLALLYRLAMPMHLYYYDNATKTVSPGSKKRKQMNGTTTTTTSMKTLQTLDISFIDLLLKLDGLREPVKKCLCSRIKSLKSTFAFQLRKKLRAKEIKLCKELESLLSMSLKNIGISSPAITRTSTNSNYLDDIGNLESCTVPEHRQKEITEIRNERRRLLKELDTRKKENGTNGHDVDTMIVSYYGLGGKTKLKDRIFNGCLLVTEKQMKHSEFCRQVRIMRQVNKTLPRPFNNIPGGGEASRPMFHKCDKLSSDTLTRLRSLFFEDDTGSLRRSIFNDVDLSARHGYINFSNASCKSLRNDYRWQVPIKRHTVSSFVSTRAAVESLFSETRLLHPHHERIHDLGILIGGTEDQSIHHDIPRQTTSWLPEDPDENANARIAVPVSGWEFDRAAYNEAMASPYAPSSILLGMSESGNIQVGVQKNQVERYGCPDGWCRILNGREDEQFQIMRENDYLVVLQANPGALFTGDFAHAGVRNFPLGSEEDRLMKDFYGKVETIREGLDHHGNDEDDDHPDITRQLMEMMCNFHDLNKICRFHCSTEPTNAPLRIPRNVVGFVDCRPNPPDVGDEVDGKNIKQLWSTFQHS